MARTRVYLSLFFLVFLSVNVKSQVGQSGCNACDNVLNKDQIKSFSNVFQYISWFDSITEINYEERKHEAGASVSVPIPIVGQIFGMLSGSANYSDFQKSYSEFKRQSSYQSLFSMSTGTNIARTSAVAVGAWRDCVLSDKCDAVPFKGFMTKDDLNNFSFSLRYSKYFNMPDELTVQCSVKMNGRELLEPRERQVKLATGVTNFSISKFKEYKNDSTKLEIKCTPTGKTRGSVPLNNFTYTSIFFKPTLDISHVVLDYTVVNTDRFTGETQLSPNHDGVDFTDCVKKIKKGAKYFVTCDNQWCASFMEATITAPKGYKFFDIYNSMSYDLVAINADGTVGGNNTAASWNMNQVNDWRRTGTCGNNNPAMFFIPQKEENVLVVAIITGSGPTRWKISKEAVMVSKETYYPAFNYANHKIVSIPIPTAIVYDINSKTFKKFSLKIYAHNSSGYFEITQGNISDFISAPINSGVIKLNIDLEKLYGGKQQYLASN